MATQIEQTLYCGVDVGAAATKVCLVDAEHGLLGRAVRPSGVDYAAAALGCLQEALTEASATREQIVSVVSTGYGRHNVEFADATNTELHCHGVGCYHHFPRALTIVDIGGQDNKVIHLDDHGKRIDFKMNRKCAAGTGAFIEEIALRLDLDVAQMDPLAASTEEAVKLSSFCTVFAKTEILSHLRQGVPVESIVRGAFRSVVLRVVEMDPLAGEVVLTGGLAAHNPTLAQLFSQRLGRKVLVPPEAQLTGALGAAILAARE